MKALTQFSKKRFNRLQVLLKAFPAGNEKEELHRIRLEIKKIKALLRLIHFNNKKFRDHKHYLPLRNIFRETGKIRDAGLRKELLEQHTRLPAPVFRSHDLASQKFKKEAHAHHKAVRKQKIIIFRHVREIHSHTYTLFMHKKKKELHGILSEGITQKDLHGLRKLIKELTYLTLINKKKSKIDPFLIESAALIGSWHDKRILIPWIRTHAAKEKETIKRLQTESNTDLQNLRKMVGEYLTK